MSESIISVRNISKSFGGRKVVDNLSLSVAPGEVFGLLGHNGAGKSTTLRSIAGLVKINSGTIKFSNQDISKKNTRKR